MTSKREAVLSALFARLQPLEAKVLRGGVVPEHVPAAGLLVLRDGDPGEPEVTLSPLRYHYEHRAVIEAIVQGGSEGHAGFDRLLRGLGAILNEDRTLGGVCDWIEVEAPEVVDLPVEGSTVFKAAEIKIALYYVTDDPLG